MKYELHGLDTKKLPFIFRKDVIKHDTHDYTHWHENIEILYIVEGDGIVDCNFTRHSVKEGDIFIINSENLHMVESENVIRYYCLIIDTEFCDSIGIPTTDMLFIEKSNDEEFKNMYLNVVNAYEMNFEYKEARIKYAVISLLIHMLNYLDKSTVTDKDEPRNLPNIIKLAIKFIKENFQKKITINEIAEASGLSRAYFSRKFKEITGFTVVDYVNRVRCQNACKLLRSGKYKINAVAVDCGFDNMSYFTKMYKKCIGVLPSEDVMSYILIFDSGFGGLSVFKEALKLEPNENYIYFADQKHMPYGDKTKEEVRRYTLDAIKDISDKYEIRAIVIACNTATSAAVRALREIYPIPIVGIEPAIKPAAIENHGGRVGVMATALTIKAGKLQRLISEYEDTAEIIPIPCSGLMDFVEELQFDTPELQKYLEELFSKHGKNFDALVLGCTHYPFLRDIISRVSGCQRIYDGSLGTVKQLFRLTPKRECDGKRIFLSSLDDKNFEAKALEILKH